MLRSFFLLLCLIFVFSVQGFSQSCVEDTVFYEDFANGFAGNNALGLSWDTTGTYQAWRDCPSDCGTNGSMTDVGPLQSTTASNGYVNLDMQYAAGYATTSNGPPPEQHLTIGPMDLSALGTPLLRFETAFYHCCASGHELQVRVSTDGGSTWTDTISVLPYISAGEMTDNPALVRIPLSNAIASNPSNVTLRFTWPPTVSGTYVSGLYNWYIDDVFVGGANRNDLTVGNTTYVPENSVLYNDAKIPIEYTQIPSWHMDPMNFGAQICNIGRNTVNNVRLRTTVIEASTGNQVYQGTSSPTSVDSFSCIGGDLSSLVPPVPDTVWTSSSFSTTDTGSYIVRYEALLDTVDCDTSNNMGPSEEFRVTEGTFAVDDYARTQSFNEPMVSPPSGGGYGEMWVMNIFEFAWADPTTDTVQQICFHLHDTTEVGAGPISAGIRSLSDTIYASSQAYYVQPGDPGSWICLELTQDGSGNPKDGLAVPVPDGRLKTAFVHNLGSYYQFGISTSGIAQGYQSYVIGDFGGGGFQTYTTDSIPMVRISMSRNASSALEGRSSETAFHLGQNRPNPATGRITVPYRLERAHRVTFTVRDVTGKLLLQRKLGRKAPGRHRIEMDGSRFDAGVYYYSLKVDNERTTRKMVVGR